MNQRIGRLALTVRDYDEAIAFYVGVLGFRLVEDTAVPEQDKRWVVVAPSGDGGAQLVLAKAADARQADRIGDQTGGRVFLFLYTDDIRRDVATYGARGVRFVRDATRFPFGTAAVFEDLYGNLWDLIEPADPDP